MKHQSFPSCKIQLNSDFQLISKWAFQWKILFNPDTNKQPRELHFCNKWKKSQRLLIFVQNAQSAANHKHLGLILDFDLILDLNLILKK